MSALKEDLLDMGEEILRGLNPSPEDRMKMLAWLAGIGNAAVDARTAATPEAREAALAEGQGYRDALTLKTGEYALRAHVAAEKALWRLLSRVAGFALAAVA